MFSNLQSTNNFRCSTCKRRSIRNSGFIELSLNIQNCNTIFECINDLLKVSEDRRILD